MSVTGFPSPPMEPRPPGRRGLGSRSLVPLGENSTEKCGTPEQTHSGTISQHKDYIPEEILQILTSATSASHKLDLETRKDAKVCLRSTDNAWHHQLRRSKFNHLIEQPVCLKGAGRDISFLCDVILSDKRNRSVTSLQPISHKNDTSKEEGIQESLVPEEYYIVKNKGILGLEYHEDKYTTLLKDDEKKLRLFPSLKPSGRSEVLQLIKVMDSMLKDAGVDEDLKLEGPTPIHNLLELLKAEQNIYNIVFHEVIRQVSVECVERGELLAKLRQRYAMLFDKIPRQVLSLYNDLLAQRALDRCLTKEIMNFKNSIEDMTNELYQVREHDLRVSRDANQAHAELAKALSEAKKNANILDEYRELYELQRSRLEKHLVDLTEERDLWSSATYMIASKVIERNQLHLARKLCMCEKTWTNIIRHFIVMLASTSAKDLIQIQQITESWRGHMAHFDQDVQRNEESNREKLRLIQNDLDKWQQHFQENVFVHERFEEIREDVIESVSQDLRKWDSMLNEELQQFEGCQLLSYQESLSTALDIQKQWTELGEKLLRRHQSSDKDLPPEEKALVDMKGKIQQLCEQYRRRIEGENGVADALMAFSNSLKEWTLHMSALKGTLHGIRECDWSHFYDLISEWRNLAYKIMGLIGVHELNEENGSESGERVVLEDIFRKLQQWVLAMTSGTERDDQQVSNEVNTLHSAMVLLMVNVLLHLTPDYPPDLSELSVAAVSLEEDFTQATVQKMQEDALRLSVKLKQFSCFIVGCCQEMVEDISIHKTTLMEEDPDYELKELETIKNSCNEWIETCQLLLSEITKNSDLAMTSQDQNGSSFAEVRIIQNRGIDSRDGTELDDNIPEEIVEVDHVAMPEECGTALPYEIIKDGDIKEDIIPENGKAEKNMKDRTPDESTLKEEMIIIWHDGNIHRKSLNGDDIPVPLEV
ncbi:hypothetical protein XENTR_v10012145 [Xenopus tropicalis]|nr:hypothetical protein XENTR_v10012145 [Xenopus tropicalis]